MRAEPERVTGSTAATGPAGPDRADAASPGRRGDGTPTPGWNGSPPEAKDARAGLEVVRDDAGSGRAAEARPEGRLRRAVDVVGATILIVVTLPLLLAGMAAVLFLTGRPILYGSARVGKGGRPFRCWKLRTMAEDADDAVREGGELRRRWLRNGYKMPGDPRVTRPGRWLRRTYLDELPQLFNVLEGSMTLVGPRPPLEDELHEFGDDVDVLLSVRPGIFGAWNSLGRARPEYPERARIELEYVRDRSFRRDVGILLRSIPTVLRGQNGRV